MIYFIQASGTHLIKIGVAKDPEKRRQVLQTGHPHQLLIMRTMPGGRASERWLHHRYRDFRVQGEWFRFVEEMKSVEVPEDVRRKESPNAKDFKFDRVRDSAYGIVRWRPDGSRRDVYAVTYVDRFGVQRMRHFSKRKTARKHMMRRWRAGQ